jgi:protein SCO1/2
MDYWVKRSLRSMCGAVVLALTAVAGAGAQGYDAEKPLGSSAQDKPSYLAHAGIVQRLGTTLPMASVWTDATGKTGPLSGWFDGKPVVMAEVYYKCVMLCPQVLHGLAESLKETTLKPGKDYDVVVFSIDPMDTPQDALGQKQQFLHEAGWGNDASGAVHFLTGQQASIDAVSEATGFHFVRVPGPDGKMDQFAHSSVVMFATPDGRVSRYLAGINYPARDVRMALLDASEKKISNPVDLLILYCCDYSPMVGKYTVSVVRVLGIAGMISLVIVIGMIVLLTRKPKSRMA